MALRHPQLSLELIELIYCSEFKLNQNSKSPIEILLENVNCQISFIQFFVEKNFLQNHVLPKNGNNFLHIISSNKKLTDEKSIQFAQFFIAHKIDLNAKNSKNMTPYEISKKSNKKLRKFFTDFLEKGTFYNHFTHPLFPSTFRLSIQTILISNKLRENKMLVIPKPLLHLIFHYYSLLYFGPYLFQVSQSKRKLSTQKNIQNSGNFNSKKKEKNR